MKIDHLSIEELKKLQNEAQVLLESKKTEGIHEAYEKAVALAESVDMTLQDFVEYGNKLGKRKRPRKPVATKYRDTENETNTWSGRGLKPKWLTTKLEAGAKLEDYAV